LAKWGGGDNTFTILRGGNQWVALKERLGKIWEMNGKKISRGNRSIKLGTFWEVPLTPIFVVERLRRGAGGGRKGGPHKERGN